MQPRRPSPPGVLPPRIFQVNQTNAQETEGGILCAPDDALAGHELLRTLREGDVLFHYNSRLQRTHAVSVVEPVDPADPRLDRWRPIDVRERQPCFLAYAGRHLTQEQPPGRTRFLLAFSRLRRRGLALPNAFPRRMIYMREIQEPTVAHQEAVRMLTAGGARRG